MRFPFFVLFSFAIPVLGCSCRSFDLCELLQRPTLFIGEVIDGGVPSLRDDPWYANVDRVRFKVLERFRGLPPGAETVDVEIRPSFGMCSPVPFFPGGVYLVAPSEREGKFHDGSCYASRNIKYFANGEVQMIRDYFAGKMPVHVQGRVAVAKDSELVDYLLRSGEAKAIAGVAVSTTRGGKTWTAVSGSEGRYNLALPEAGNYVLRASLPPYAGNDREVQVSGGGCAVADLALRVDNTISGTVWDERGQPLEKATVGLIDLDRDAAKRPRAWFDEAYSEFSGAFKLENVPVGRYLLVFNPGGPQADDRWSGLPFETTYYPMSSARSEARVVEISSGGTHLQGFDLAAGKPVEFRKVRVAAHFPDGAPMETAVITCTGAPLHEGELPWKFVRIAQRNKGFVEFQAPVNRKLTISVTDLHGRDLGKTYEATFEPGSGPIAKDFAIAL